MAWPSINSNALATPIRNRLNDFFIDLGGPMLLFLRTLREMITPPIYWNRIIEQVLHLGMGSLSITIVIGLTIGLVMTLQFGFGLARFGGTMYVPQVVALALTRELAPMLVSLLFAGRAGSGMAAEISAMAVSQQIDAIRALGTSPIKVIVVPRLIATVICLPLLTVLANIIGFLAGMVIAVTEFQMTPGFYIDKVMNGIKYHDLFACVAKPVFFAIFITILACHRGMMTRDGTKGVGQTTTWVVVASSILILVSDFFLTKLFLAFVYR